MYVFMPGAMTKLKEFKDLIRLNIKDVFLEPSAGQHKGKYVPDPSTACSIEEHDVIFPLDDVSKDSFATMV